MLPLLVVADYLSYVKRRETKSPVLSQLLLLNTNAVMFLAYEIYGIKLLR